MNFPVPPHHLPRRAGGQALVELLVAALFFLVPLFLAIAAIGKFLDVQHTADMSARYAAWERTVWYDASGRFAAVNHPNSKTSSAIKAEIATRMLYDRTSSKVILDTDKNATTLANGTSSMWEDAAGKPLLEKFSQLDTSIAKESPKKDVPGKLLANLGKLKVGSFLGFVPPVPNDTLAVAHVRLQQVGATSEVYQRLWSLSPAWTGLDFDATGAILSNSWAANGNAGTHDMVEDMVPTAQKFGQGLIGVVKAGILPWDPIDSARIDIGRIDPNVVPKDRLK